MNKDDFGDRMKDYESVETDRRLDPRLPVYARIDGRGFSKFTRGLQRPYDSRMSQAMIETTRHLVAETNARIGYTQSDEISLVWIVDAETANSDMFFSGKVQKLASVLASLATAAFTAQVYAGDEEFRTYARRLPHFDARVFNLPSKEEGANAILWRTLDANRNAIQMTAHHNFSHKQLHGVPVYKQLEMITEKGIEYNEYPVFFRRGTFLRRVTFDGPIPEETRMAIPEAHRPAPGTLVTRSEVREIDMPPFVQVRNRVEVVFDGADPVVEVEDVNAFPPIIETSAS